jgi:DNA-directed RNA polymerase subunit RPC12/RpoP
LYRVAAIVLLVLVILLLLGVGIQRTAPMPKVPKMGLAAFALGALGTYLALGLPAMRKEVLAGAADAFLLGGILFLIQGIGVQAFALVYRSKFGTVIRTEQNQKKLLAIVESRGQVKLDWLAGELGITRKALEEMIYQLVGEKRFRGYIDWKEGDLYAAQAKEIKENRCPHCGAEVEMVGKGVVKCPYCGAETFL